jgi:hypothetical protein
VVAESIFSQNDRLTFDGGIGFGYSEFMGYKENAVVGGRAGMQFAW